MANTKEVKRRIKLVKTTSQITRAMELVVATKMRKAETDAKGTRPYFNHARKILRSLVGRVEKKDSSYPVTIPLHDTLKKGTLHGVIKDFELCFGKEETSRWFF